MDSKKPFGDLMEVFNRQAPQALEALHFQWEVQAFENGLTAQERHVFQVRFVEERKAADVASELKVDPATAYRLVRQVKAKAAEHFSDYLCA